VSPEPASYDPEEFVDGSQPWPRLLAFKDGELLAKGEIFEHQTAVRPKPAKHGSEPEPKQVKHGNQVIADRLCRLPCEVVDFTAGQDCDEGQKLSESDSKDALTKALKDSFAYCEQVLAKADDSTLGQPVALRDGRPGTRAAALIYLAAGWADHYSAAAMYLRLNNLLPPSAQKAPAK